METARESPAKKAGFCLKMAAGRDRGLNSSSATLRTDENRCKRVYALIDMDCFYVQVEQRFCPETKGKPCAVVQYKKWRGGG